MQVVPKAISTAGPKAWPSVLTVCKYTWICLENSGRLKIEVAILPKTDIFIENLIVELA